MNDFFKNCRKRFLLITRHEELWRSSQLFQEKTNHQIMVFDVFWHFYIDLTLPLSQPHHVQGDMFHCEIFPLTMAPHQFTNPWLCPSTSQTKKWGSPKRGNHFSLPQVSCSGKHWPGLGFFFFPEKKKGTLSETNTSPFLQNIGLPKMNVVMSSLPTIHF